jgi:hypothetical protein
MAIDFPASPTLNDVFTVGNVTYVWDGTKWTASVTGGISLDKIEEGNTSAEVIDTGSDGRFVVTTEGTERLRVTNTGLVGIGTSTFSYLANKLVIDKGSTANDGITIVSSNTSNGCIWFADGTTGSEIYRGGIDYNHSTDKMQIYTGGLGNITIDSAGRLGIGTTNPGALLHLSATAGNQELRFSDTTNTAMGRIYEANGLTIISETAHPIIFQTNAAERLRIDSSGRVGIGTSTPDNLLHVKASGSYGGIIADNSSTTGGGTFRAYQNGSLIGTFGASGAIEGNTTSDVGLFAETGGLRFYTNGSAAAAKATLDSSGRLGIGTTSPGMKLTINDTTTAQIQLGYNDSIYGRIGRNSSGNYEFSSYENGGNLLFGTTGTTGSTTERARIDASGRLLVGTSSARGNFFNTTASAALQIEGTATARRASIISCEAASDTGGSLVLAHQRSGSVGGNTIVNNGDIVGRLSYQGNDGAEFVEAASINCEIDGTPGANDMPGRLVFSTTADGASSPTERMRINTGGEFIFRNSAGFYPFTDNALRLGDTSNRWSAVYAVNGTIQTSDQRAKANIVDSQLGTNFVKSLRPVSYKWIEGGKRDTGERDEDNNYIYESVPGTRTHWGFIAQEVKQAVDAAGVDFGGWVLTDKDDPDSQQALRYDQFIAPLTKALQEAMTRIETLEAANTDLAARLTALEGGTN